MGARGDDDPKRPPEPWIVAVLEAHNTRRAKHWTAPLVWSDECYHYARMQADACQAAGQRLRVGNIDSLSGTHGQSSGGPFSPAIAMDDITAEKIVAMWYKQISLYDFDSPGPNLKAANFAQIVWG